MSVYEPKKLLILRILEILKECSDADHKLKQSEILRMLEIKYGIECERKAVARNIEYLAQAGFDVVSDRNGVFLNDRKFENYELRLLIDSVLANGNICARHTEDLIEKLKSEGTVSFKPRAAIISDGWQKTENTDFFLSVDIVSEAIDNEKQLSYVPLTFGADKKLHPRGAKKHIINPYRLILKNGNYYLVCNFDKYDDLSFIRIDRMSKIEILNKKARPVTELNDCHDGLNIGKIALRQPYLYYEEPQRIVFESANNGNLLNHVFDWFGKDVNVTALKNGEYRFSLMASPRAMRYWILQFGKNVRVLEPTDFRQSIIDDIEEMRKLYLPENE